MSVAEAAAPASWEWTDFAPGRLAAALEWTQPAVEETLAAYAPRNDAPAAGSRMIGLAIISALHREAGLPLPAAVALVRDRYRLCDTIRSTVDFFPPGLAGDGAEKDPFKFFAAHASEAMAVPAIDHFLDVMDGRRVLWRRPTRDPYHVACELHRLSEAVKGDDTPALQEQYLELLSGLRGRVPQFSEWIGTVAGETFMPAPDRFFEPFPAMRQGVGGDGDPSGFANTYGTCVSVNVSLAARCFKRRMLGLEVSDPFARHPPAYRSNEGATVAR